MSLSSLVFLNQLSSGGSSLGAFQPTGSMGNSGLAELLEWASAAKQIQVSPNLFNNLDEDAVVPVSLADAIETGGVHYDVTDSTKEIALRAMVELIPVPANLDRQTLLNLFLARERWDRRRWVTESQFRTSEVRWCWVSSVPALRCVFSSGP